MLYTVGHGNRTFEELVACLRSFEVETVADVRSYPASRHHPHFGREELEPALVSEGFTYRWLGKELGGFRSEGYEAHMETDLFREGLSRLLAMARESVTVILCAERGPSDCHRRHIAAAAERAGVEVAHILDGGRLLQPGERPEDQGELFT
ncbi:MAG: DUF488 domain-containing protein [Planctomycetota bacterium]